MSVTHVPPQYPTALPAKIAFIAEAPSWDELDKGAPLVGPSGRVFNSLLRTANMERSDFFIGNVFDEKIPDNKIKNWCVGIKEAKATGANAYPPIGNNGYLNVSYHHQLDRLHDELVRACPTVIVPLGGTAMWAFTGKTNISAMRGTVMKAKYILPGVKVIPTFHPRFVMQKYQQFGVVVRDLQFALEEANNGPEESVATRRLIIEPTLQEMWETVPHILEAPLLSLDIETGWGQITSYGISWSEEEAISIPFVDLRQPNKSYWRTPEEEFEAWKFINTVNITSIPKLGQNFGGYDFLWILKRMGMSVRNFREDTRLMHHALYPELPKDLGFMGAAHSTQGAWKHMGKKGDKRDDT